MAEHVPDPDYVMDNEMHDSSMNVDDPEEPVDDYYDNGNGNNDFDYQDRESTPIPEDGPARNFDTAALTAEKRSDAFVVNNAAIDLEALTQSYSGICLVERLQFVIDHCPPLQRDATVYLINLLRKDTFNVAKYTKLFQFLETIDQTSFTGIETPVLDQAWVDETTVSSAAKLDILLSEYKKHKDEGVKESTRRAMDDLIQHYLSVGCNIEALRIYGRGLREYCRDFKHIINMFIQWLELVIIVGDYGRIDPLIAQAERSITDAEEAESASAIGKKGLAGHPSSVSGSLSKTNKQLISCGKAKLDALNGIAKMILGRYRLAAEKFIKVDIDLLELPWMIHSSELASYAVLCVLASFDRTEIKKRVLLDTTCRKFLEAEPKLVELLQNFVGSQFGKCFDILTGLKDKFLLDPYLTSQVDPIFALIRERALMQYFIPFSCASLTEVANKFRTTNSLIEDEIVQLIENDKLNAKIDSVGGVVRIHQIDPRQDTYRNVLQSCEDLIERAEVTFFRTIVNQSNISCSSESRNKRKGGNSCEEASDPMINTRARGGVPNLQQVFKSLKHNKVMPMSEADSSEGSDDKDVRADM